MKINSINLIVVLNLRSTFFVFIPLKSLKFKSYYLEFMIHLISFFINFFLKLFQGCYYRLTNPYSKAQSYPYL